MSSILLIFGKTPIVNPLPPSESFWIEDESADQMVTDSGDTYVFLTGE